MSGADAARQLLEEATREEFLAVALVARALRISGRRVLRDWHARRLPITRVGRQTWLASTLVVQTYFPHAVPVTQNHSRPFQPRPDEKPLP